MPRRRKDNDTDRTPLPATDLECDNTHEPLAAEEAERLDTRVSIRVISYRKRKHDPDGVSVKAVLDGLVRRGVLEDDSTDQIKEITFESHKADEEKTVIVITDSTENIAEWAKELENE